MGIGLCHPITNGPGEPLVSGGMVAASDVDHGPHAGSVFAIRTRNVPAPVGIGTVHRRAVGVGRSTAGHGTATPLRSISAETPVSSASASHANVTGRVVCADSEASAHASPAAATSSRHRITHPKEE